MQELNTQNLDGELFVSEYSFSQRCFHHSFLKKSLEANRETIEGIMQENDIEKRKQMFYDCVWIPFSVGSYEGTNKDIDKLYKKISELEKWIEFYKPNF